MRNILILNIFAFFVGALTAQTTPRSSPQAAPSTRNAQSAPSKAQPENAGRSALQPGATARSNNGSATRPSAAEPAADATPSNNRTGVTTPKSPNAPSTKTVPAKMPDAPQPKQDEPMVKVQWMTMEEALEKSKTDKRKIFIDVFTDWCGWCKRMDESTFVDPSVAQYLNDNFYAVKLNAEQQQEIVFNNKTYSFRKNGARGYHELAAELLNNRLSFPTVVFMDETLNVIQPIPGYLEAPKLETILNYFGTDSHKTTPWETYERKFGNNQK
jgi:thioredoxin-related protein